MTDDRQADEQAQQPDAAPPTHQLWAGWCVPDFVPNRLALYLSQPSPGTDAAFAREYDRRIAAAIAGCEPVQTYLTQIRNLRLAEREAKAADDERKKLEGQLENELRGTRPDSFSRVSATQKRLDAVDVAGRQRLVETLRKSIVASKRAVDQQVVDLSRAIADDLLAGLAARTGELLRKIADAAGPDTMAELAAVMSAFRIAHYPQNPAGPHGAALHDGRAGTALDKLANAALEQESGHVGPAWETDQARREREENEVLSRRHAFAAGNTPIVTGTARVLPPRGRP
jgi:hypothetical protein